MSARAIHHRDVTHGRTTRLLTGAAAVVATLGFALVGPASATTGVTTLTPSVNALTGVPSAGHLNSVTCLSATHCVAVGADGAGDGEPIVLDGNPATWTLTQARVITLGAGLGSLGDLLSVACPSPTLCVAVGTDGHFNHPLVLVGNPATWTAAQAKQLNLGASVGGGGSLDGGVSCTSSTNCVAVGVDAKGEPLVLRGNPVTWNAAQASQVTLAKSFGGRGQLTALTCTSATSCVAGGMDAHRDPLSIVGNPASWTTSEAHHVALTKAQGSWGTFSGFRCTSSTSCVAVGNALTNEPFTLSGNPATWTAAQVRVITIGVPEKSGGELSSLACSSATACVAVGFAEGLGVGSPVTLVGNPLTWTKAQLRKTTLSSTFGSGGSLNSLACSSTTSCVAAGTDGAGSPLTMTGSPATWSTSAAHQIRLSGAKWGASGYQNSFACPSNTQCVAVGTAGAAGAEPLSLDGSPASWASASATQLTLTTAEGTIGSLTSVACPASTTCVAVGETFAFDSLLLVGNPTSWTSSQATELALSSKLGTTSSLAGVACVSTSWCIAVGTDGGYQPFQLVGDPTTWTAGTASEVTLGADFGSGGTLNAVTCTSSSACVAVGTDGNGEPFALSGDPASWTQDNATELALGAGFGSGGTLNAVTCPSSSACVAVGTDGSGEPLVVSGNPTSWSASNASALALGSAHGSKGALTSVACAGAGSCVALGSDQLGAALEVPGDPGTWSAADVVTVTATGLTHVSLTDVHYVDGSYVVCGNSTQGPFLADL
jgi:hypothetical protein